jgi:hypothetical protein
MRLLKRLFERKEVIVNSISPNVFGLEPDEEFRIEFKISQLQEFINMTRVNGDDTLVIQNEKGRFEVYTKKKSDNDRRL